MATSELILTQNARFKSTISNEGLLTRFTTWCAAQEKNRMLWIGSVLGVHGCILTPITLAFVIFAGIQTWMLALTAGSIMLSLVAVLSAVPMKNAIPVWTISLITNLALIAAAIVSGLEIAKYF